jgi:hypothetical protein
MEAEFFAFIDLSALSGPANGAAAPWPCTKAQQRSGEKAGDPGNRPDFDRASSEPHDVGSRGPRGSSTCTTGVSLRLGDSALLEAAG